MSKHIIITGSQGNLGKAVTKKFSKEGYVVTGTVEPGKLKDESSGQITYHEVNLLDAEATNDWAEEIISKKESIDSIVCLVGGFGMADLKNTDSDKVDKMIKLNFFTAFNVVQAFLQKIKNKKDPVNVILIGAKPAIEQGASKGLFPYALSKSMTIKLAEAINDDREDLNALATVVVPSVIDTPPNREAMPDASFDDWVTPESIANKIYFACSEAGKDLRGTVLKVYGNS